MILELKNVNSYYGLSQILFNLSLNVDEAEAVSVLGRNGVGKSTMMKTIVGLMNPKNKCSVEGEIEYCGQNIVGMAPFKIARAGIAYVPQGRHIFPTLTVKENLRIAQRTGVDGKNDWTLDRIYEQFPRLKERENFLGGRLSGGEQQMLTIARGLLQNPKLLLLDEITEGLAPIIVNELKEIVQELRKQNVTILLAEQNVNFALGCSKRCYIIEKGTVVYSGLTAEIPQEVLSAHLGL